MLIMLMEAFVAPQTYIWDFTKGVINVYAYLFVLTWSCQPAILAQSLLSPGLVTRRLMSASSLAVAVSRSSSWPELQEAQSQTNPHLLSETGENRQTHLEAMILC